MHPNRNSMSMVCFEYDSLYRTDFTHPQDFDYLLTQDLPCFQIQYKQGRPIIYVRHYLAIIGLPSGEMLEILPKISQANQSPQQYSQQHKQALIHQTRDWVREMLAATSGKVKVHGLDAIKLGSSAVNNSKPLVHYDTAQCGAWHRWLSEQYLDLLQLINEIAPRHYQTHTLNATHASGKLNIKAQIKQNWHRPHYIASEQDRLNTYELLWQFLITGDQQLQLDNLQSNSIENASNHKSLRQRQQQTKLLPRSQWQRTYNILQLNIKTWRQQLSVVQIGYIEQAVAWAWWLMQPLLEEKQDVLPTPLSENKLPKRSFMLNMTHLFEQWVGVCLYKWCQDTLPHSRLLSQPSYDWLCIDPSELNGSRENGTMMPLSQRIRPDFCILDAQDNISHVMDAKYKNFDSLTQLNNQDLYQISSYQQQLGATQAWLIYPRSSILQQTIKLTNVIDKSKNRQQDHVLQLAILPFCVRQGRILI